MLLVSIAAFGKTLSETIKSSIVCEECEDRVRNGLIYEKGIKRVTFDLETAEIFVKYNPKQITLDEIRTKITELGYDADDKKANEEAFKALPGCCQAKGKCSDGDQHNGHGHGSHDGHKHE